jgi:histone-lysine N-methyltransferase MLL2
MHAVSPNVAGRPAVPPLPLPLAPPVLDPAVPPLEEPPELVPPELVPPLEEPPELVPPLEEPPELVPPEPPFESSSSLPQAMVEPRTNRNEIERDASFMIPEVTRCAHDHHGQNFVLTSGSARR